MIRATAVKSEFAPLDRAMLDAHPATIVAVDASLNVRYVNRAWHRFAAENGGEPAISRDWGIGVSLLRAIPAVLAPFYRQLFTLALRPDDRRGLHPLTHEYECSSATRFRLHVMSIYPLRRTGGLLLVHSLRVESPIEAVPGIIEGFPGPEYVAADGLVRQCACCRRVRSERAADQWHWIRPWVLNGPEAVSHTLCPVCLALYFGDYRPH